MSGGWVDRFKSRHSIVMKVVSKAASSKGINIDDWMVKLQSILHDYPPCDIFNANETRLYKCLSNKSVAMQGERCTGQKVPMDRITPLCTANMDGSEKFPLLAIGKFERPRCFKDIKTLP